MGFASPFNQGQCCCKRNDAKFQFDTCAGCPQHSHGGESWACRRHRESAKRKRIPLPAGGMEPADLKHVRNVVSEALGISRDRIDVRSTGGVRFEIVWLDGNGEVADVIAEFLGKREVMAWTDGLRVGLRQAEERREHEFAKQVSGERHLTFDELLDANRQQKHEKDALMHMANEILSGKKQVK